MFFNNYLRQQCEKENLDGQILFLIALYYETSCYVHKIQMKNDFIEKIIQNFLTISSKKEVDMKNSTFCYFLCKVYYRNDPSSLNEKLILFENIFSQNEQKFNFEKEFYLDCLKFMVDISDLSGSEKIDDFLRRKILYNANNESNFLFKIYQTINNEDHPFFKEKVSYLLFFLFKMFNSGLEKSNRQN